MKKVQTLQDFYDLMLSTIGVRRQLAKNHLNNQSIPAEAINSLRAALDSLQAIPQKDGAYRVALSQDKTIPLDLSYEINELRKDIFFLEHDEDEFEGYLGDLHEDFYLQVKQGVEALQGVRFRAFLTDRDGTVNNYCGRYISSVQSVYNAVFLTRFATAAAENSVILTSAPLDNIGLVDISVSPSRTFIYAGSKGREYFNTEGQRRVFPIEQDKQTKLDELNAKLSTLLKQPKYEMYGLIGSGLQFKFGQTTIARQDITRSILTAESEEFLNTVRQLVSGIDPDNVFFRIEDTGLDIEIILTVEGAEGSQSAKDFDKGDGIKFLNQDMGLHMAEGSCLVCGDTNSDVPMVAAAMDIAKETYAVFVTRKDGLKDKVRAVCPRALSVSEPDVLVTLLYKLSKLGKTDS